MLEELKFVQGAVAKKDFIPALNHFAIEDGVIKGFNGRITLSTPIKLDLTAYPKAIPFVKAVERCRVDPVTVVKTKAGRLSIKSGGFKVFVDCCEESLFPPSEPEGDILELNGSLLEPLKVLSSCVSNDASRPWSNGVLFNGVTAVATNNIVIVEHMIPSLFPKPVNIPIYGINELLRIKQEPTHVQLCENSITFHYAEDKWLKCQLLDVGWPDIGKVLDGEVAATPIPEGLFQALEDLIPFVDENDSVHLNDQKVATHRDDGAGAEMACPSLPEIDNTYQLRQLMLLQDKAQTIDFTTHPTKFFGKNLRGAIIGMKA